MDEQNYPNTAGRLGTNPTSYSTTRGATTTSQSPSEFDSEAARLDNFTSTLIELIKTLETRLAPVLRLSQPAIQEEGKNVSPNTGLGQYVRRQSEKVSDGLNMISGIIGRLEI